ncbi:hypothetical protein [Ichthyobacterium seriolicida]|nr:hypothetical protein [Ichthyobacterium seriolicida]
MRRRLVFYFGFIFLSFLSINSLSNNFPDKLSYQLVIRKDDKLLKEFTVSIRISIYSLNGKIENVVYSEVHWNVKTDKNGLATLKVGEGIRSQGFSSSKLSDLEWSEYSYYIKSEIDLTGNNNYSNALIKKSQILSVPYAFYAADSPKIDVIDNLSSRAVSAALSANKGRDLEERKLDKIDIADNFNGGKGKVLSADRGKELYERVDKSETKIFEQEKELTAQKEGLKIQSEKIDKQEKELTEEKAELTEQKAELNEQKAELTEQKAELNEQKAELTEEKEELTKQKAELTEQKAELTEEKEELTKQKAELTKQKAELTKQKAELTNKIETQKTELTGKINTAKATLGTHETRITNLEEGKLDVITNLTLNSENAKKVLSAHQGYLLKQMIDAKAKRGPAGARGERGETGAIGPKGEDGQKGDQGEQGLKGDTGLTGPQGLAGAVGPPGPTGAKGEDGKKGPKGDRGETGPSGPKGQKGDTGAQGPKGEQGEKGQIGPAGPKGDDGAQGPPGEPGPEKIIDDLDSEETTSALSAKQGKVLAGMIKSKSPFIKTDTGENIITLSHEGDKSTSISGTKNMLLGIGSKSSSGSPSNEIAIGSNAQGKGSNTVVLGNDKILKTYLKGRVMLGNSNRHTGSTMENMGLLNINGNTNSLVKKSVYFNKDHYSLSYTNRNRNENISLYASHSIATSHRFLAISDKRIKSIKGLSDKREDLKKLLNIEITDYTIIDSIESGVKPFKKVIAQQVENILPDVISISKGVIPNMYELAKSMSISNEGSNITTNKAHNFSVGDLIKVIIENDGERSVKVKRVIDSNTFLTEEVLDSKNKVFIYGKEVDDLRSVDYDGLTTLNISATQAVYEELVSTKEKLSVTNQKLSATEQKLSTNEKELSVTKEKLSNTENKLDTLNKGIK